MKHFVEQDASVDGVRLLRGRGEAGVHVRTGLPANRERFLSAAAVLAGFSVPTFIGVSFGNQPACRASRLAPVATLQGEQSAALPSLAAKARDRELPDAIGVPVELLESGPAHALWPGSCSAMGTAEPEARPLRIRRRTAMPPAGSAFDAGGSSADHGAGAFASPISALAWLIVRRMTTSICAGKL